MNFTRIIWTVIHNTYKVTGYSGPNNEERYLWRDCKENHITILYSNYANRYTTKNGGLNSLQKYIIYFRILECKVHCIGNIDNIDASPINILCFTNLLSDLLSITCPFLKMCRSALLADLATSFRVSLF